jgi:hypothetical protein
MTLFTGIRLFQVSTGTYVAGTITYDPTQRIATFTPTCCSARRPPTRCR